VTIGVRSCFERIRWRPVAPGSTKAPTWLAFGPPGVGKSHLAAALGQTLIENGYRVLFTRTTDMVQRLQAARRDLTLASVMDKLDLLILDDLSYVRKDQAETSVLFELISARYERRSMLITANQPFGSWDEIGHPNCHRLAIVIVVFTVGIRSTKASRASSQSSRAASVTACCHNAHGAARL
jgi:chromosomal replication initiation ATPase DnaA